MPYSHHNSLRLETRFPQPRASHTVPNLARFMDTVFRTETHRAHLSASVLKTASFACHSQHSAAWCQSSMWMTVETYSLWETQQLVGWSSVLSVHASHGLVKVCLIHLCAYSQQIGLDGGTLRATPDSRQNAHSFQEGPQNLSAKTAWAASGTTTCRARRQRALPVHAEVVF